MKSGDLEGVTGGSLSVVKSDSDQVSVLEEKKIYNECRSDCVSL